MPDEPEGDRPDTEPAFQPGAFQSDAFQVERERFYGAQSPTFAGILYTALITVVGVVVAMLPVHGGARVLAVTAYVAFAVLLFVLGVAINKVRSAVIAFSRSLLYVPPSRG
jgi:VIT1/CCC1 family predicted Fe2+/Mn2+ transporter